MISAKFLEDADHWFIQQRADKRQAKAGGFAAGSSSGGLGRGVELGQGGPRVLEKQLSRRGEADGAGVPDQQCAADASLQGLDLPGERRLAQVELPGRAREVQFLRDRDEAFQLSERGSIHAQIVSVRYKLRNSATLSFALTVCDMTPIADKSTIEEIRARFDVDVERFSSLETGQQATIDAPLVLELVAQNAATHLVSGNAVLDLGCGAGNFTLCVMR